MGSPRRVVINNNLIPHHAHGHSDSDLKKAQKNLDAARTTLKILQDKKAGLERQLRDLKEPMGKAARNVERERAVRDAFARQQENEEKKRRERERERGKKDEKVFLLVRR